MEEQMSKLSWFAMASVVVEQWQPKSTLNLAIAYLAAARELLDAKVFYAHPFFFLVGHAIELGLKAFLLSVGVDKQYLQQQQHRHDIERLLDKATLVGLSLPGDLADRVREISPAHKDFFARYGHKTVPKGGIATMELPWPQDAVLATNSLLLEISKSFPTGDLGWTKPTP
jgi:hypothetical protein